jgi:hypothetical protein
LVQVGAFIDWRGLRKTVPHRREVVIVTPYDRLYDASSAYGIARSARTIVIESFERYVAAICALNERG